MRTCGHTVLFLSSHQQSLLILLFQKHQLHLVILKGVVALRLPWGSGS
jgi:hypothetical protein